MVLLVLKMLFVADSPTAELGVLAVAPVALPAPGRIAKFVALALPELWASTIKAASAARDKKVMPSIAARTVENDFISLPPPTRCQSVGMTMVKCVPRRGSPSYRQLIRYYGYLNRLMRRVFSFLRSGQDDAPPNQDPWPFPGVEC